MLLNIKQIECIIINHLGGIPDKEYFKKFFIDLNTACWPNGADVAPESSYESGKPVQGQDPNL